VLALGGHGETGGAGVRDDRQVFVFGKVAGLAFSGIDQWADNAEISFVDGVVGFHGFELSPVKCRHHETLRQVIQVLGQGNYIKAVFPGRAVHNAPFDARAKRAIGGFTHVFLCHIHNGLAAVVVFHPQGFKIGDHGRGVEVPCHWVHGHGGKFKFDRCMALEVIEDMQQG